MGWLLPLVSSLVSNDIEDAVKRTTRGAAFCVVIAILGVTAYVFAMLAAYLKLTEAQGALNAALILAIGTVVVVGSLAGAMSVVSTIERRRAARRRAELHAQLTVAMSALPLALRAKPLLIAAAIGALVFLGTSRGKTNAD